MEPKVVLAVEKNLVQLMSLVQAVGDEDVLRPVIFTKGRGNFCYGSKFGKMLIVVFFEDSHLCINLAYSFS